MSRRLIVRPEAESDIIEAAVWYEAREVGLGVEVTGEIRAAILRALQTRLDICVFANVRTFDAFWCEDFPIASFMS